MTKINDTINPSHWQEPCEDCISRADAEALFRNARGELHKSAIRNEQNGHPIKDLPTRDLMLLNAEQMIHLLPSVNPQPCEDTISRQAAIDAFSMFAEYESNRTNAEWVDRIRVVLSSLSPVTPKQGAGHWVGVDQEPHEDWECDRCGHIEYANEDVPDKYHFCPNCGAKMSEPQEREE